MYQESSDLQNEMGYRPQMPNGDLGAPVTAGVDDKGLPTKPNLFPESGGASGNVLGSRMRTTNGLLV
jgi:hypothetical protein